ncbi:hypothetical protein [Vibrio mimicus]|uniref:hypothetical protein n=1 Tax=Vibrio mimicus TaxID=674 RepID=UPI0011D60A36|nr:hypothetical protein [Vibrio mimicus]TXY10354.1 hypothetical protein FXE99_10820 [Vibrio mimicus]BCN22352.1 hypothetical protein [Vibrio mimicus]
MNGINLCISGKVFDRDKEGLEQFWKGFIAIQRVLPPSLPIRVFAHSTDSESENLIRKVFGKDLKRLHISGISVEPSLNELLKSEKFSAANRNRIIENFDTFSSKGKVICDLVNDVSCDELVFLTDWKAGFDKHVQIDASLPKEYIYFQYSEYVDYGYSENWLLTSGAKLPVFTKLPDFYLESIANYIEDERERVDKALPLFIKKTQLAYRFNVARIGVLKKADCLVARLTSICAGTIFYNKMFGLGLRIKNAIQRPNSTGENSHEIPSSLNCFPTLSQLTNREAFLKGYVLSKKQRQNVRFVDDGDFLSDHRGSVINPVEYCYVILTNSEMKKHWQMLLSSAEKSLGDECKKIIIYAEECDETEVGFEALDKSNKVSLLTYPSTLHKQAALDTLLNSDSLIYDAAYVSFDNQPLVDNVDKVLLNSLFHHLSVNDNVKIDLVDTFDRNRSQKSDFPGLNISSQPPRNSFFPAIYNLVRLRNKDSDANIISAGQDEMDETYYLRGYRKVNKICSINNGFPHLLIDEISESAAKFWLKEISVLEEEFELRIMPETAIEKCYHT